MKPRIKNHFRAHQLSIWLRLIPELHRAGMEDVITRHNLFKNHDDMNLYEGPVKPDPFASTRLLLIDDALLRKAGRGGNLTGSYISGVLGGKLSFIYFIFLNRSTQKTNRQIFSRIYVHIYK